MKNTIKKIIIWILCALFYSVIVVGLQFIGVSLGAIPTIILLIVVFAIGKSLTNETEYDKEEPDSSLNEEPEPSEAPETIKENKATSEPEQEEEEAPEPDISDIKEYVTEIADSEDILNTKKEESLNKKSIKKTPYIIAISILSVALIASVMFSVYKITDDNNAIAELQKQSSEYKNTNAELESEIADKDKQLEDYNYLKFQYSQIKAFADYKLSGKISKDIVVDDVLVLKRKNGTVNYQINYTGQRDYSERFGDITFVTVFQTGNSVRVEESDSFRWAHRVSEPLKLTPIDEGITVLSLSQYNNLYRKILVIVV